MLKVLIWFGPKVGFSNCNLLVLFVHRLTGLGLKIHIRMNWDLRVYVFC